MTDTAPVSEMPSVASNIAIQAKVMEALLSDSSSGGVLCNDPSGLCVNSKGRIDYSQSGIYTNLTQLASRLEESYSQGIKVSPLITLETDRATLLVKEYDGHAVVLRVPNAETPSLHGPSSPSNTIPLEYNS